MTDPALTQQARTRLRRIEGQVRGIQRMLDRMDEEPAAEVQLQERVQALLADGKSQAQIARTLEIGRRRVPDIADGRDAA
ncbi:MAG: metal-sensing transcriptional repressor, partial [Chloroflexi bacterium]|nr:metal-sensing transcriptional repressor [Chloroflexota bacterium]